MRTHRPTDQTRCPGSNTPRFDGFGGRHLDRRIVRQRKIIVAAQANDRAASHCDPRPSGRFHHLPAAQQIRRRQIVQRSLHLFPNTHEGIVLEGFCCVNSGIKSLSEKEIRKSSRGLLTTNIHCPHNLTWITDFPRKLVPQQINSIQSLALVCSFPPLLRLCNFGSIRLTGRETNRALQIGRYHER